MADFSNMFSGVFNVWTKNFLEFFVVYVLLAAVILGLTDLGGILLLHTPVLSGAFGGVTTVPSFTSLDLGAFVAYELLVALVSWFFGSIAIGSMTDFSVRRYRGEKVRLGESFSRGFQRLPSVLGANFLVTLATTGAIVLPLFVALMGVLSFATSPGVAVGVLCGFVVALPFLLVLILYLLLSLFLYGPAIMVEGAAAVDSLQRSWTLTKGYKWSIFGTALILGILSVLFSVVAFVVGLVAANGLVTLVASILLSGLTGGWFTILAAVVYHLIIQDQRAAPWPWPYPPAPVPPR